MGARMYVSTMGVDSTCSYAESGAENGELCRTHLPATNNNVLSQLKTIN